MAAEAGQRRTSLIGRDDDLQRVTDQVLRAATSFRADEPASRGPHVTTAVSGAPVLVLGEAGTGKSALLDVVTGRANSAGFLVLSTTGAGGPVAGSFAGLDRVLGPVREQAEALGGRLVDAVIEALGWRSDSTSTAAARDQTALLPLGVLAVLSAVAEERPVLVCVDDVQALDTGSRNVLAAVVRRLSDSADEGIAVVFAQRGTSPLASLAGMCDVIDLRPLSDAEAGELLDRLDPPVVGRTRFEVLRVAAGNPLALLELGRVIGRSGLPVAAGEHLPVTDTIRAVFARDVGQLPAATRRALLFVACGEDRLPVLESETVGVVPEAWEPAEIAGLVVPVAGVVRFRHPLLHSVVYDAATPTQRRSAHTVLAQALADEPGRSAWQRSAGLDGPDEQTAVELEAFAASLAARGDAAAAATTLERAAAITADGSTRSGRLLRAAELAGAAGSVEWALELSGQVEQLTEDPGLRGWAAQIIGWSALMADRPQAALDHMLAAVERVSGSDQFRALQLLGSATSSAYIVGTGAALARLRRARDTLDPTSVELPPGLVGWCLVSAVAAPGDAVARQVDAFAPPPGLIGDTGEFQAACLLGAACYFLDRSEQAAAHLVPVIETMRHGAVFMPAMTVYGVLGWALLDTGRWQQAADLTQEVRRANALPRLALVDAVARVQDAMATALRGGSDTAAATQLAESGFDPEADAGLAAHMTVLRGRLATAEDDPQGAWSAYRSLFDSEGRPRHRHLTGLALAEVVAAARRAGRLDEVRALVLPVLQQQAWRSSRQSWVESRAHALLADDDGAAGLALAAALADSAGRTWPFERALAQLELASLWQRERRTTEARDLLAEAIETFVRLGARPFEDHVRRLLRSAGVSTGAGRRGARFDLSAQQVQIVRMAAEGLTNREIGEQLFLSPRTVASHLYRAFPTLGVASRVHLPAVVAEWDAHPLEEPGLPTPQ